MPTLSGRFGGFLCASDRLASPGGYAGHAGGAFVALLADVDHFADKIARRDRRPVPRVAWRD